MMAKGKPAYARISKNRESEIAELAEFVAQKYTPQGQPTNLNAVIKAAKITLSYGNYKDAFDGMLEHKSGAFHIYCNVDRVGKPVDGRARFTVAHELGHFFIDEHRNALRSGQAPEHGSFYEAISQNPVEQEANIFASNLLMPSGQFIKLMASRAGGLDSILCASDRFQVSITSAALRYVMLGIKPCAVVKWSSEGKYEWSWISQKAWESKYWGINRESESIPPDSPTGKALAGINPDPKLFHESGSLASAWFRRITCGSPRDVILKEQAIILGRFGVLTFIHPEAGQLPEDRDFISRHSV